MFAHVPDIPGQVVAVSDILPADNVGEWHSASGSVAAGWNFDGQTFTPPASDAQIPSASEVLLASAYSLLQKSDQTVIRCAEAGVDVPSNWKSVRAALRKIIKNESGTLPLLPTDYPPGT